MRTLLIGYGNPGRGDDGLGPALCERIERRGLPDLDIDIDYQLTAEHALAVADAGRVIFADAIMGCEEAYSFGRAEVDAEAGLSSHSMSPGAVLSLASMLYGKRPDAYVLAISGHEFGEVKEGLSDRARRNLDKAEAFFLDWYPGGVN